MGLTNERAEELVADAQDFVTILAACQEAFTDLYQPLRDTQKNDVPVRAAVIALAAQRSVLKSVSHLASPEQWPRLPDTVYGLRAMLDDARSMRRRDVAILSDAFGILRELLLRRPLEFGGPKECR